MHIRWPCLTPSGLAVDRVYVEIESLWSLELIFYQHVENLQREKKKLHRVNKTKGKSSPPPFLRAYLQLFFLSDSLETKP